MNLKRLTRRPRWLDKLSSPVARRIVTGMIGVVLIGGGVALTPLPGPLSIPLILAGLTVLSWEFKWARTMRQRIIRWFKELKQRRRQRKQEKQLEPPKRRAA